MAGGKKGCERVRLLKPVVNDIIIWSYGSSVVQPRLCKLDWQNDTHIYASTIPDAIWTREHILPRIVHLAGRGMKAELPGSKKNILSFQITIY